MTKDHVADIFDGLAAFFISAKKIYRQRKELRSLNKRVNRLINENTRLQRKVNFYENTMINSQHSLKLK